MGHYYFIRVRRNTSPGYRTMKPHDIMSKFDILPSVLYTLNYLNNFIVYRLNVRIKCDWKLILIKHVLFTIT